MTAPSLDQDSIETPPVMPAIYMGHGAPPLLDDPIWSGQMKEWAANLPRPRAVIMVSAHWESAPLSLSAPAAGTPLVYDFGGFDPKYYRMTYATPDATELATRVAKAMPDTEPVHVHPRRGLDHGAWVPMKIMYPEADIPVLQLSLPTFDPARLMDIGARLRPLREEGVLVIGSGFMTHGLPFLRDFSLNAKAPGWSKEFDSWAAEALARGDVETLANFHQAPGMPYAHPTLEHLAPLFVTLGAAQNPETPADPTVEGFWMGLSKRSFQLA